MRFSGITFCLLAWCAGCDRSRNDAKAIPEAKIADPAPQPASKLEPARTTAPTAKPATRHPNGSKIPGWGTVSDPDGDCTIREEDGYVTIRVPGTVHDINPTKDNHGAPRILRPIEGDFRAVVRVTSDFEPALPSTSNKSPSFNGAGIVLYQDESNLFLILRDKWIWPNQAGDGHCYAPLFELFQGGRALPTNPPLTTPAMFKGQSTALYLERKGDTLIGMYSHDNKTWEGRLEAQCSLQRKLQIGVCSVSTSSKPFTVAFDQFKILDE